MKTICEATDTQLVRAFKEGDNHALDILINRYKQKIFTSLHLLLKDKYLAEDMFQELFIKIIDKIRANTYNEEGKFLSWALRIAHNMCIDHFRKVKRSPTIKTSDDSDIFEVLNFSEDTVDKTMMKGQTGDMIAYMINRLPADQREVIVLRHYAELTFKEIALRTNTSINTALGRMRYGIINMRKMAEEKQFAL